MASPLRPRPVVTLLLAATAAVAHDYPPGGDCVRAHPEHSLTAQEAASGPTADVVCRQKPAPDTAIKVACVGDSITAVGHTSGIAHHWPNQLQDILDKEEGTGKYSVTNLGICGASLSDHGAAPYWRTPAFKALIAAKWDIVFVMLGTNDARDIGSGGPEHWPRATCDDATADTLGDCSFAKNYTALLDVVRQHGRTPAGPEVHVMIPPALMEQGAYAMNQTVINTVLPRLVPLIAQANRPLVRSVIDVYTGMGGVPAPVWKFKLPANCTLNSAWQPCAWYCDKQSCDQCHPNDVGCAHLAQVVYRGCTGCWSSSQTFV